MISLKVDSITLTSNLKSISFDFNCDCMFSISLFAFSIALFVFSIALFDWLVNQVNPFFLSFSELELVLEVKLSFAPKSSWSVYRIVSAMENTINLLFISICVINTVSLLILSTDVGKDDTHSFVNLVLVLTGKAVYLNLIEFNLSVSLRSPRAWTYQSCSNKTAYLVELVQINPNEHVLSHF